MYALTTSRFLFRFDAPPPTRSRFLAFPHQAIVSAAAKWIIVPGMSELALEISGPNDVIRVSFYVGKREQNR